MVSPAPGRLCSGGLLSEVLDTELSCSARGLSGQLDTHRDAWLASLPVGEGYKGGAREGGSGERVGKKRRKEGEKERRERKQEERVRRDEEWERDQGRRERQRTGQWKGGEFSGACSDG